MNCRRAYYLLSAERDGPLEAAARTALEAHLAACPACRRVQADLAAGFAAWRAEATTVSVPDAQQEWLAVRRRMRGADREHPASRRTFPWSGWVWRALPVAAATALAALLFFPPTAPEEAAPGPASAAVARANSVEVPGEAASTMVFVDDKSGWLIVWASDTGGHGT